VILPRRFKVGPENIAFEIDKIGLKDGGCTQWIYIVEFGARDRLDFTVVGPAVNEASRIQALCQSLERNILISSTFQEIACGSPGGLESLGFHGLRGVSEPQELFTLGARGGLQAITHVRV